MAASPHIVTNMAFSQDDRWTSTVDSIAPPAGRRNPPPWPAWRQAAALWSARRHADVVLTGGARESLLYGLLCAMTRVPSRQILAEVFIDDPRRRHALWRLKTMLYRRITRRAIGLLTNSSDEVDSIHQRFAMPREQIRYVPMHTQIREPRTSEQDEGFVFSAGRSLRDYPTLVEAAPHIDAPLEIVCGRNDLAGVTLPPQVRVLREIDRGHYLDRLARCRVVAIPLRHTSRATGQVVMLEAMALGKPVITNPVPGTRDHIRDGDTGLLVPIGDARRLADSIMGLVLDPGRAGEIGRNGLQHVLDEATIEVHAERKLAAITELWHNTR